MVIRTHTHQNRTDQPCAFKINMFTWKKLAENDITYFSLRHIGIVVTADTIISITPVVLELPLKNIISKVCVLF